MKAGRNSGNAVSARLTLGLLLFAALVRSAVAAPPELVLQLGHSRPVTVQAWAAHAPILATGSEFDGIVKIWKTRPWGLLRTLHVGTVTYLARVQGFEDWTGLYPLQSLALSPDGRILACNVADYDPHHGILAQGDVQLWNVATGAMERVIPKQGGFGGSLAFAPQGRLLAVCGRQTVLWDSRTGKQVRTLEGNGVLAFSSDGRLLANEDGGDYQKHIQPSVKVWDVCTGKRALSLSDTAGVWGPVAFSPDGRYIATGGEDPAWHGPGASGGAQTEAAYAHNQSVKLWYAHTGRRLRLMPGLYVRGTGSSFRRQSQRLVFSADSRSLITDDCVFAIPSGKKRRFLGYSDTPQVPVAQAATAQRALPRPAAPVLALAFAPDGRALAAMVPDDPLVARLWDTRTGRQAQALVAAKGPTSGWVPVASLDSIAFTPQGRVIVNGGDNTARLEVAGKAASSPDAPFSVPPDERQALQAGGSLRLLPDGKTLLGWSSNGQELRVRDAATGALLRTVPGFLNGLQLVTVASDGSRIANLNETDPHTIDLCHVQTGTLMHLAVPQGVAEPLVFSGDGKTLASPTQDRSEVLLWEAGTGLLKRSIRIGNELVSDNGGQRAIRPSAEPALTLALSPDGGMLAIGGVHQISVRDSQSGRLLFQMPFPEGSPTVLAFSPDGQRLAAGDSEGFIRLWDLQTRRLLFTCLGLPSAHADWISFKPGSGVTSSPGAAPFLRWRVGDRLYGSKGQ